MKRGCRILLFFIICLFLPMMQARAAQEYTLPPHLIQTVSEQDIYEGMLSLGMLKCPVLKTANCEEAFEIIEECVVRVEMGHAYGSGILWDMTPDAVVVATNRHVLDYWQDADSCVYFPQGYYVDACVLGVSGKYDVGFLRIDSGQLGYQELEALRVVSAEAHPYNELDPGTEIFCAGSGSETGEVLFYEAEVEDKRRYIADFDAYMLYGTGFAREGMSGGGIFDGYGHLVGMITGGTLRNEIAGVPLLDIVEAYGEIAGYTE